MKNTFSQKYFCLCLCFFLFYKIEVLNAQSILRIMKNDSLFYSTTNIKGDLSLNFGNAIIGPSNHTPIPSISNLDTSKIYYKWYLKDSIINIAYYGNRFLIDGSTFFNISKFLLKKQPNTTIIKRNNSASYADPLNLYIGQYELSHPDSVKSILFDIFSWDTTNYMGILYPSEKQLTIWRYINDSTYIHPPFGIGIYHENVFNWEFLDKVNVDSLSDFLICKTANGFLIAKSDGQSFILHNGTKSDQRTLPKSAKFLFIQEENKGTIMSVDANGNTVASTVYTW